MFRRFVVQRFEPVTLLAGGDFKRQNGPCATFLRACPIRLIGKEEFARVQEKGPESSAIGVGAVQIAAFEDANEKVLGQVLGLFLRVAAPAHVGVNGIPVVLAQARQGLPAILTQWMPAATTSVQLVVGKSLRPAGVCDVMALPFIDKEIRRGSYSRANSALAC